MGCKIYNGLDDSRHNRIKLDINAVNARAPPSDDTNPKKRIRREIPEEKKYIAGKPTKDDVVAGRGGGSNNHPGNLAYWQKILPNRELYKKSQTNEDKTRVAQEIVDFIKSKSGRFLQKEKGVGERWFVLPDNIAIYKVKQALRDAHIPRWARNLNGECNLNLIRIRLFFRFFETKHERFIETKHERQRTERNLSGKMMFSRFILFILCLSIRI